MIEKYLERKNIEPIIKEPPKKGLLSCIVIPCHNEPNILNVLNSLNSASQNENNIEVLIVINDSETDSCKVKTQNKTSYEEILSKVNNYIFTVHPIYLKNLPTKKSGVGFARKTGMDEALSRFVRANNNDGIIISLDADCSVKENYFKEIFKFYSENPKADGANIYFEHNFEDLRITHKSAITQYELYLRFFKNALNYINLNSFHTVGSSFSVKASAYAREGGMNSRKGGEDFYFITKIAANQKYFEINTTTVFPSPRISKRVPFGTGPALEKIISTKDNIYYTSSCEPFIILKDFYSKSELLFKEISIEQFVEEIDSNLSEYLLTQNFNLTVEEIRNNTAGIESFKKRFNKKFDTFFCVQFINYFNLKNNKIPIENSAKELLQLLNISHQTKNIFELLDLYRRIDRGIIICS